MTLEVYTKSTDRVGNACQPRCHIPVTPQTQVLQEKSRESHQQVSEQSGGQERGELAQMRLVHTERAAEMLQVLAAVCSHVERCGMVAKHVVDRPRREVDEQIAADRLQRALNVHTIAEDSLEHVELVRVAC